MSTLPLRDGHVVRLLPFDPSHGEAVFSWFYDYEYRLFFREFDDPLSLEQCRDFGKIMMTSGVRVLTIVGKDNPSKPIGLITTMWLKKKSGVSRVGILLDKNCQHKTWCIEALIVVGDLLYRRLGCRKLVVEYMASDEHIRRISEKGGFVFESILKDEALIDGEYHDEVKYYMMRDVYEELYGNYLDSVTNETT